MIRLGLVLAQLSLVCLQCSFGARILAFLPMPWRSHQFVFRGFIRGLAERGHQVDFYTPVPMSDPPSTLNQIKVKDRLLDPIAEVADEGEFMDASPYRLTQIVYDVTMHLSEKMYREEKVYQDLLQSEKKYDLVITEYPVASEHSSYLAHKFKIPTVAVMGYLDHPWTNEIAGVPDNPSYMISYQGRTSDRMTFFERLYNFYVTFSMVFMCYWELWRQQEFADRAFRYDGWESRPKLTEMISRVDLILVNSHISFGYPYPKAPHVKEVGGMHINPPKTLPKDLKEFMDEAPHGVIYFSLGSVVDAAEMLKGGKTEVLLQVFKSLKQKIVWKTAPGLPEIKAPNIYTKEWLPQQDILAHNNTVLFITHGGLQSMVETINCGVPVIGLPVYFDQHKDVKFMTTVGMGLFLSYDNISEHTVSWSINEVLNNPSYREQAKKRQAIFQDRPMKPVDEAVYWVEYVLRHGSLLRPASAEMPFYQVYLLDVLGTIGLMIVVLICILRRTTRAVCAMISSGYGGDSKDSKLLKKKYN